MRFTFIQAEKANHDVSLLCEVLQVSRQGYYAWLKRKPCSRKRQDMGLLAQIRCIYSESDATYGSPRIHKVLAAAGQTVGRNRIAKLMKRAGIVVWRKRRFVTTTDSKHGFAIAKNVLNRNFAAEGPNRVWATDITYIPTRQGWLYLAVVLDLYSRRVVGWSMQPYMDRRLVLAALQMAIIARKPAPGLIHHSDRGVQYACDEYRQLLADAEMVPSMSRTGDCWDNAVVESFFGTLKRELVDRCRFVDHDAARTALFRYIEGFYNRRRLHSTLGYLSPEAYERRITVAN